MLTMSLQVTLRLGLVFSCLLLAILTPQIIFPSVPNAHAVGSQTPPTPYRWTDMLSGGLWAMLNHSENRTGILNSTGAQAIFNYRTLSAPSYQDPPSTFTSNFRVTSDTSLFPLEDEPSIAVTNQSGHVLMVVGANSLSTGLMPAYISKDQGTTWMSPTFLPLSRANDSFASDPGLAVNRTGTFFYSFLSIGNTYFTNGTRTGQDDLVVATSQDGGNWTNHVAVKRQLLPINSAINFELYDKPYITVGPSPTNPLMDAVYVTYTDFVGNYCSENSTIMEVHSNNAGVTWSAPHSVSPTVTITSCTGPFSSTGRLVQGSVPAVDARNGGLYIAYYDSGKDGFLNGTARVMITKSTDGGASFSPSTRAALISQQVTYYSSGCISYFCNAGFRWWSTMFPSIDVAQDGTVYIAYGGRQSKNSLDPADVFLVASTDGALTWSQPVRINDNSSQNGAFFAWLKVSSDGVVHIIWGDRRLDPAMLGYDIFYAEATNHGATIGPNVRVTDVGTDPLFTIPFIGDYFNLAVSGNQVYPVWTDGRRAARPLGKTILQGETDIFTARLGPRDASTLSIGAGPAAGYQPMPVTISGSGLPREAFFSMKMNGAQLLSQTSGFGVFFTDRSGGLSDVIIPNSNYYGAYPVEIDEWLSGVKTASASLYVVDTRSLQVLVTGPSVAHAGDDLTWNIQLIPPTGSLNPGGLDTKLTVNNALLTFPNGASEDVTSNITSIIPTSYSLRVHLPANAEQGSYTLLANASQTGLIVQSRGIGTASLTVSPRTTSMTVICTPSQVQAGQVTICLAAVTDVTVGSATTPIGTVSWTASGSGTFSAATCTLSGTGTSASCWVNYTPSSSGAQAITGRYSGDVARPGAAQLTNLVISPSSNSFQISALMLGALTGGVGIVGIAAGAVASILVRRRKPKP
jgi:BNR repeat-like domain